MAPNESADARLAALSPEKLALLLQRLEERRAASAPRPAAIPRLADRAGPHPLSHAQTRFWLLYQLDPAGAGYNIPAALRLRGRLDEGALRAALDGLGRRHEALRTRLAHGEHGPEQRIDAEAELVLASADLRAVPEARRQEEALRMADELSARPFDLGRAPLFRAALLRLGDEDRVLVIVLHHAIGDVASVQALFADWGALYEAALAGVPPRLPDLSVQYADYAAWERASPGEDADAALAYWRAALDGLPSRLGLPYDAGAEGGPAGSGDARLTVAAKSARALAEAGRGTGATPFMVSLAAFLLLLRRLTGRDDVAVGSPVTGRDRPELEGVMGPFVNTLVLRADLSGDPTFAEAVARVREACLGAFAHRALPHERVVEALRPGEVGAGLYEVTFTFHDDRPEAPSLAGLSLEPFEARTGVTRGSLHLDLSRTPEGALDGQLSYDRARFLPATAERMARLLARLIEAAAERPDARLSELDAVLDAAERERERESGEAFRESRLRGLRGVRRAGLA